MTRRRTESFEPRRTRRSRSKWCAVRLVGAHRAPTAAMYEHANTNRRTDRQAASRICVLVARDRGNRPLPCRLASIRPYSVRPGGLLVAAVDQPFVSSPTFVCFVVNSYFVIPVPFVARRPPTTPRRHVSRVVPLPVVAMTLIDRIVFQREARGAGAIRRDGRVTAAAAPSARNRCCSRRPSPSRRRSTRSRGASRPARRRRSANRRRISSPAFMITYRSSTPSISSRTSPKRVW